MASSPKGENPYWNVINNPPPPYSPAPNEPTSPHSSISADPSAPPLEIGPPETGDYSHNNDNYPQQALPPLLLIIFHMAQFHIHTNPVIHRMQVFLVGHGSLRQVLQVK
jgi:hypothetical protein